MTTRHLVDPELLPIIDAAPTRGLTRETLAAAREQSEARFELFPEPALAYVRHSASGRDGAPDVPLLVFTPEGVRMRPAILYIHGGGMVLGSAHSFRRGPAATAAALDAVVVSVDYRLAPEAPFPAPQEDCYTALCWLAAQADALGVDPARIIVAGESAGGGLAAAVALMARDRGGPALAGQLLTYPMLDYRTGGPDCAWRNPICGEFVWTAELNRFGWDALKGDYALDDARIGWFSPTHAGTLADLPPSVILTGALDLFVDENFDYARRLAAAAVEVELHCYPGAIHGFQIVPQARVSQAYTRDYLGAARRLLGIIEPPPRPAP
jgi:triacylglycerol lipase